MQRLIGIDLGGTSAKIAIIDSKGKIIEKWSLATDIQQKGSQIVPNLISAISNKLAEREDNLSNYLGIGMGSPGTILADGSVKGAYNLNWVEAQPVKSLFESELGLPFAICNDANAAALGELWQGAGKESSDLVMMTLGTGVGGGIISQNQLIQGATGSAGEIGHITVDFSGNYPCTCGKTGCLEAIASAKGIINLADQVAKSYPGQSEAYLKYQLTQNMSAEELIIATKAKDEFAMMIFEEFSRYLGIACSYLANILNPNQIVIGGGISNAGSFLLKAIDHYYQQYVFSPIKDQTKITLAELGNDAGILGAAYYLLRKESGKF